MGGVLGGQGMNLGGFEQPSLVINDPNMGSGSPLQLAETNDHHDDHTVDDQLAQLDKELEKVYNLAQVESPNAKVELIPQVHVQVTRVGHSSK